MMLLITGTREGVPLQRIQKAFDRLVEAFPDGLEVTLVHGAARGVDQMCAEEAIRRGWNTEAYPANWTRFGKAAGPIRNQEMVDLGPDFFIAFPVPHSRGTRDCIRRAKEAKIPGWVVEN